ncbi:hypothetical protein BDR22DRAFT_885406 [Usnea florida]
MSFLTSIRPPALRALTPLHHRFSTTPASHLARMTIVGRLADNPEIVPTSTGRDVVKYVLGTSSGKGENKQTSWWHVSSFIPEGGMRDLLVSLGKGSLLCVEGECSMRKFQAKDGAQVSALSIVEKNFEVLNRKEPRGEGQEGEGAGEGAGQTEEMMERM